VGGKIGFPEWLHYIGKSSTLNKKRYKTLTETWKDTSYQGSKRNEQEPESCTY
jgi:hypothetical protein